MKTMRAVCIHGYGGPEVLVYEDAPCPRPREGEVLVRVHAAGINPIDWKIREGRYNDMIPTTLPLVPGRDVSGVVEWKGAHVIGSASQRNPEFLRALGVDQVVEYPEERFEEWVEPVDVVLDTVGGDTQDRSWKVLKRGGILVSSASPLSAETAEKHGVRQAFVMSEANGARRAEIAQLAGDEKLKATVETILPLSDATRGQELSERGHVRGKIVLRVIEP